MTTRTTARPTTGAGHPTRENGTMTDTDLHHLFDLIRDDRIRFKDHRHVDTAGVDIDDLVYAAEDRGLVTVHPNGVVKTTPAGMDWRARHHRPARTPINVIFQPAAVA